LYVSHDLFFGVFNSKVRRRILPNLALNHLVIAWDFADQAQHSIPHRLGNPSKQWQQRCTVITRTLHHGKNWDHKIIWLLPKFVKGRNPE